MGQNSLLDIIDFFYRKEKMASRNSLLLLSAILLCQSVCIGAGAAVTASSVHSSPYQALNAFDGNGETRWASASKSTNEFLQVDLGEIFPVNEITINWEAAYASEYDISISDNKTDWEVIASVKDGKGGKAKHRDLKAQGRFIRIICKKTGPHPLYSIWEVSFGNDKINRKLQKISRNIILAKQDFIKNNSDLLKNKYGFNEIVFAMRKMARDGHWYANLGYYAEDENRKAYTIGGKLCKLDITTGNIQVLLEDKQGTVRDPVVHYDAQKILFSYRKGGEDQFHLWQINVDGTGLKQLTFGKYDDIEPVYLPDDRIMFCSTRGKRWVNCWLTQVATLHRCNGDGSDIHEISANIEHDNTPWVMPDGKIIYTRWEYIDRSQVHYHHLWIANPDGTNQTVYFGNLHPGSVFIDAKPIPGTEEVLIIDSPGHGRKEHMGRVATVTDKFGPDNLSARKHIHNGSNFRDPYPLSAEHYIAAVGDEIQLMNSQGQTAIIHKIPTDLSREGYLLHEPRPIMKRKRERIIPDRIDPQQETGKLILTNVYNGRNMKGVKPGSIKKLLIMETLPKPINYTGGMAPLTYGGTFTLERILGTVPVEKDGSAFMELPANRPVFFIALDEKDNAVKRMQSFTSVAPGEMSSCFGCHEERTNAPQRVTAMSPLAARKPAKKPKPIEGIPQLFDFPRDIQPILDKHCVKCHNPEKYTANINLSGDHGPMFSHSYMTLTMHKQFVDGRNDPKSNFPPYSLGAYPSPLMKKVLGGHNGVKLSDHEIKTIRFWIESAAAYPGTYAALATGLIGGYQENRQVINNDSNWPESKKAAVSISRRCDECHKGKIRIPKFLSDERGLSFWRPNWNDEAMLLSRHSVFNLSRPEKSLMLLVPLAKTAGGHAVNTNKKNVHPVVFKDTNDADYQAILAMVRAGKKKLDEVKRFDMPGFKPRKEYIREMKRYGILPADFDIDKEDVDVYKLDELYWKHLWYYPEGKSRPGYYPKSHDSSSGTEQKKKTGQKVKHSFLCSDVGRDIVAKFSADGKLEWEYPINECTDAWMLENGNVLISSCGKERGVREVTPDKKIVWEYKTSSEVWGCQRLENGNTMIAESSARRLIEANRQGEIVKVIPVDSKARPHWVMRYARKLKNGNYLVCLLDDKAVWEYDSSGKKIREMKVPDMAFSAVRLENGNTVIGYKTGVIEIAPDDKVVWHLTQKDVPGIKLYWINGIQRLKNGNTVVGNWFMHKRRPNDFPFFEVTGDKKVVWKVPTHERMFDPISIQILDGVSTPDITR